MSAAQHAHGGPALPHASELDTGQVSRTFSKGLRVLETLAESDAPLTAQEIAKAIGSDRAIVYRMLRTLSLHGLLSESEGDGKFSLGLRFLSLARHIQLDVRRGVYPILEELADAAKATAFLGLLDGDDVVSFASVEPRNANVTVRYREGVRHPAGKGASGIAIDMLRPHASGEDPQVELARRNAYATSVESLEPGAAAVSVPIPTLVHGQPACATIVYAKSEDRDTAEAARMLQAAARRIAAVVGR